MLEGLTDIKWEELEHAYGDASDVPNLIQELLSEDPDVRDQALWSLYGNIFHQGTRYEATTYAIPFIFEIIRAPKTEEKVDLVKFTVDLALGYPEAYLPKGPNVENWIVDAEELKNDIDSEVDDWINHIDHFIKCYKAVLKEVPTYYDCLENEDEDLRVMAIFALAWFRETASQSASKIRELLKNEKNENVIASALISLSMLDAYQDVKTDATEIKKYLTDNNPDIIRISASIALINMMEHDVDDEVLDYLIINLPMIAELEMSVYDFPWNDGEVMGFVSEVLKFYGLESPEKIIPPMCKVLKTLSGFRSFDLTYSLLWMVFPDASTDNPWILNKLDKYQKMVLRVLANNPNIWLLDGEEFANFTLLMEDYNLPKSVSELRTFLNLN